MTLIPGESTTVGYLGLLNPISSGTAYTNVETLVTNAASQRKTITMIHIFNFHSSAVTVNGYYLPNSSSSVRTPASEDDYKIFEESIDALDFFIYDGTLQLNGQNDTVRLYASTADVINVFAFGAEYS
ncbi:hypothetical protein LCGC14_1365640 [marine sediment metagenome]|uniref:Uncharacterized protein n=1 Tax=marine sediment metagenome TaxID=412755 RepID=A0A0F9MM21_9ZZZZ